MVSFVLETLDEIRHHSKFCDASIIKLIVKVAPCSPIIIEIKIAEWVAMAAQRKAFNIMLNCIHARKEGRANALVNPDGGKR